MKICSKCKIEKDVLCFGTWKRAKDGLKSWCKECINLYRKEYYKNNKSFRDRIKNINKEQRKKLKLEVMSHYSQGVPSCSCCGEKHFEFLSMDHIENNGREHREQGIMSKTFYRWLKKNGYPEGYRVLCMNCNFSIGVHGYCPHKPILS